MVSRAVTFDGKVILAAFFDDDVEPIFASTVLAFNVVAFVLQKLEDLFLKWRLAIEFDMAGVELEYRSSEQDGSAR